MKKTLLSFFVMAFLVSCNSKKDDKAAATDTDKSTTTTTTTTTTGTMATDKPALDLPYTAGYSGNWNMDVSDSDLKMVLMTYKLWSDGRIPELVSSMSDTTTIDMASGKHLVMSRSDLAGMWSKYRDSLSTIKINMQGWTKIHSTDKNGSFILTWYDEYDTYKDGRVDSATFHDINEVKNGKITWYSTYKRPLKAN